VKSGKHSLDGPRKQFGENVEFTFQPSEPSYPSTSFLVDLGVARGSEILKDFSMKYDELITSKEDIKKNCIKRNGVGKY
jgi:hypothetical protein